MGSQRVPAGAGAWDNAVCWREGGHVENMWEPLEMRESAAGDLLGMRLGGWIWRSGRRGEHLQSALLLPCGFIFSLGQNFRRIELYC